MSWPGRVLDAVKYKRVYKGVAEKDGRQYKKYVKVERFRADQKRFALSLLLAAVAVPLIYAVVTRCLGRLESSSSGDTEAAAPAN